MTDADRDLLAALDKLIRASLESNTAVTLGIKDEMDALTDAVGDISQRTTDIKGDVWAMRQEIKAANDRYEQADAALRRAADMFERLMPVIGRVEVLEARAAQSGIDRDHIRERLRAVERKVAVLEDRVQASPMTDAPGD